MYKNCKHCRIFCTGGTLPRSSVSETFLKMANFGQFLPPSFCKHSAGKLKYSRNVTLAQLQGICNKHQNFFIRGTHLKIFVTLPVLSQVYFPEDDLITKLSCDDTTYCDIILARFSKMWLAWLLLFGEKSNQHHISTVLKNMLRVSMDNRSGHLVYQKNTQLW